MSWYSRVQYQHLLCCVLFIYTKVFTPSGFDSHPRYSARSPAYFAKAPYAAVSERK